MSSKYPIHPKAAAYRLMHDYEFEALVEGIRTNGLLVPITLAKWVDKDTKEVIEGIIDGRNRESGCEVSEVQPEYQHFIGSGEDGVATEEEIADYIEQSNARKNHTLDQLAMGIAELHKTGRQGPKPDPVTIDDSSIVTKKYSSGFSKRIEIARFVRRERGDLVPGIINGTEKPLSTIVVEINKDKKKEAERLAALKELREAAPDLARDVDDQTLDLKTAQKELKQRLEDEAEEKAKEKRAEEAELAHKRQVRQTQKEMEELSKAAPDLAKTVEDDESTLKQAQAVLQQRIEKDKLVDYLEQQKEYDLAEKLRRDELVITQAKELSEERRKRRVKLSWLSDKAPDLHTQVENGEMPLEEACEIADERPQPISYARIMNSWDSAINEARRSLEFLLKTMNEHLEVVSTIDGGVHGDVYRQKTLELQQQCVELTNLWREHTNQRKQFEVI